MDSLLGPSLSLGRVCTRRGWSSSAFNFTAILSGLREAPKQDQRSQESRGKHDSQSTEPFQRSQFKPETAGNVVTGTVPGVSGKPASLNGPGQTWVLLGPLAHLPGAVS